MGGWVKEQDVPEYPKDGRQEFEGLRDPTPSAILETSDAQGMLIVTHRTAFLSEHPAKPAATCSSSASPISLALCRLVLAIKLSPNPNQPIPFPIGIHSLH